MKINFSTSNGKRNNISNVQFNFFYLFTEEDSNEEESDEAENDEGSEKGICLP